MRPPAIALRDTLATTIAELAAFGEKRAGSDAGARAANYLFDRMRRLGLDDVHAQPFAFPRHDLARASLAITLGGYDRPVAWEVLEASGAGSVDADVVHVGWATREQLAEVALGGRIALVDRNPLYHRSTQYYNCAAAGAAAMIFASSAPGNLPQVGSIRRAWEALGPIPALTVGGVDAQVMRAALESGDRVRAHIEVAASVSRGVGRNVVGRVRGLGDGELVVGAHFDSWFAGSSDNGGGVAAMLALAERRARRPPAQHGITFVAWDGEELALYGGYHHLRRFVLDGKRPLCAIDFETPSATGAQAYGLARSSHAPLEDAIVAVGLHELFALNVPMDLVAELFGGVIPTDIQGLYRSGAPTVATAVDAPYYHTVEDTPDKVDLPRLEETVIAFDRALDRLANAPAERFGTRDPALFTAEAQLSRADGHLVVAVQVRDSAGVPQRAAAVDAVLFEDDFFATAEASGTTDSEGRVTLRLPAGAPAVADGRRFLHISAGMRWPLCELVLPL